MNCYIYFKAKIENETAIIVAERELQNRLQQKLRLITSLQRRPKAVNGIHTWMEVYENIPNNFDELLEDMMSQTALPDLQYSERHVEYFLNVDVCA